MHAGHGRLHGQHVLPRGDARGVALPTALAFDDAARGVPGVDHLDPGVPQGVQRVGRVPQQGRVLGGHGLVADPAQAGVAGPLVAEVGLVEDLDHHGPVVALGQAVHHRGHGVGQGGVVHVVAVVGHVADAGVAPGGLEPDHRDQVAGVDLVAGVDPLLGRPAHAHVDSGEDQLDVTAAPGQLGGPVPLGGVARADQADAEGIVGRGIAVVVVIVIVVRDVVVVVRAAARPDPHGGVAQPGGPVVRGEGEVVATLDQPAHEVGPGPGPAAGDVVPARIRVVAVGVGTVHAHVHVWRVAGHVQVEHIVRVHRHRLDVHGQPGGAGPHRIGDVVVVVRRVVIVVVRDVVVVVVVARDVVVVVAAVGMPRSIVVVIDPGAGDESRDPENPHQYLYYTHAHLPGAAILPR